MKLEKRYIESNQSKYDKDDTVGMEYSDNPFKTVAAIAGTIAMARFAYKSGVFKKGIGEAIDYASKYKAAYPGAVKVFKSWINAGEDVIKDKGVEGSLVRALKGVNVTSPFTKEGRNTIMNNFRLFSKDNLDETIKNTRKDFGYLKDSVNEKFKDFNTFHDTEFSKMYASINRTAMQAHSDGVNGNAIKAGKRQMVGDMIAKLTESNEKVNTNLKNSAHHALRLKDVFDLVTKTGKKTKGRPFALDVNNLSVNIDRKTINYIEKFGMEKYVDTNGKIKRAFEHEDFMNMRLDSFILANESKKMVDMRGFKDTFKFFTNSIANDFKIPILGINPFKIFGVDNFGKDKMVFGILRKGTKQASLLNKTGKDSVLNNSMFFSNGSVYRYNEDGGIDLVKKNMHILKVYNGEKGATHVNKELNSLTKMFNMDTRPKNLYTKADGKIKYYYGKVMKKLDIGFNDIDISDNFGEMGVNEYLNPNTYIQKVTNWILKDTRLRPFKGYATTDKIKFNELFAEGVKKDDDIFIAVNNTIGIKDTVKAFANGDEGTVKSFFKQFVAGRKDPGNVTSATTGTFFLFDRVNSTLNMAGLGLSKDSLSSTPAIFKNMLLKRVLPMYVGYNAYEFVNYLSEGKPDENGNRDNITKKLARGIGSVDLGYHKIKDTLGFTDMAKGLASVMPGVDQIGDLPGLNLLKLDKTYEDRVNDFSSGMEPVRKGRYWELGQEAFTGGRIMFYQPTLMRRIHADAKFSDTMYGSRAEYFRNSPFPTPLNPIAPLTYLAGGQYHFDIKHYKDRPYLETGGMFTDIPIVGQALSSTLGKILKPTIKMHSEDLENAQQYLVQSNFLTPSQGSGFINNGKAPTVYNGESMFSPMGYMAPSGSLSLVGVPSLPRYKRLNDDLKKMSLNQTTQVLDNLDRMLRPSLSDGSIKDQIDSASSQNSLGYGFGALYNNTTDFLGLYGFFGRSVTGRANNGKVIDNSGYAYSASRQFWDSNLGGLGGEISEIFRRFMYKDPDQGDLVNPIRNTMPTWMPGSSYFTNFQIGDPYKKVPRGEFRLPGEAYERMWGLGNPLKLKIGSSFIGKDQQSIIKHFFKQDTITDGNAQDIVDDGSQLHKSIESKWKRSGFAIDTEVEINDVTNNILGYYDARIHDDTAPGGEAIADIKTVNAKKFQELVSTKGFKEENMRQVNYYLYATGLKKGYLYYVNRDNPEQTYTYGFNYSAETLQKTLSTLQSARSETLEMINSGAASRGDLYEPIDRLRILGDTAPYSEEYSNMLTYMSKMQLTDEQKEEVRVIKERVSAVKNPMRLYDYQYKTSNLKYMDVTVDRVYDKETFFIKGVDTPIKLGGINLKELDNERDNEKMHGILDKYIHEGAHIRLGVDENASERVKSGTIRAIVYSGDKNINKLLLDNKYAEANDWKDPVSINAQKGGGAIAFGKLWETLAHFDTPFHTKFLHVRSAREEYERGYVYGKQYSSWNKPIHDYFKPLVVNRNVHKSLFGGLAWGALIGAMFGKTKYGMVVGTAIGLGSVAVGKAHASLYESMHHTMWKPKEVRKKEEINEYIDMLKYVKYKRLFYKYNELAKKDGINVLALIRGKMAEGNDVKDRVKYLEDLKLGIKRSDSAMRYSATLALRTKYGSKSIAYERASSFIDSLKAYISDKVNYLSNKDRIDYSNVEKGRGKKEYFKDSTYIKRLKDILGGGEDEKERQLHAINKEINELKQNRQLVPFQNQKGGNTLKLMIKSQYLNQMLESLNGPVTDEELKEQIKNNKPRYYSSSRRINRDKLKQALVKELNDISRHSNVNQNAVKAMLYYQMSEKTMYAYRPGAPVANVTAALPKSDRDFYRSFVDAPEEERLKILKMAPKYLRRPLESAWGLKVEEKANIINYFSKRALPDENWEGWGENVNLDSVKVKMVKKEDLSFGDNNIWKDDVAMANAAGRIPIPKLDVDSSPYRTSAELKKALTPIGFRDLRINLGLTNNSNNIDLDMHFDDTEKYKKQLADKADESLTR